MESGRSTACGVELRRQHFEFADSGGSQLEAEYRETPLNAFELDVMHRLKERGIPVIPPVRWAGYRIDFAWDDTVRVGDLANLTHLFLSDNRFSGYMPTSLLGRWNMGFSDLCGLQFCRGSVSDVLSATSAAHRVTSHTSPSPRATGAHSHVGRGMPRAVSNPAASKERCSPPHSSNQAGSPRLTSPPRDAVPSGPSHDRRVRYVSPGHLIRSRWLETALFPAMGWAMERMDSFGYGASLVTGSSHHWTMGCLWRGRTCGLDIRADRPPPSARRSRNCLPWLHRTGQLDPLAGSEEGGSSVFLGAIRHQPEPQRLPELPVPVAVRPEASQEAIGQRRRREEGVLRGGVRRPDGGGAAVRG